MSRPIHLEVWRCDVSQVARLIACRIEAYQSMADGWCTVCVDTLASECATDPRSVRRAFVELRALGALDQEERRGRPTRRRLRPPAPSSPTGEPSMSDASEPDETPRPLTPRSPLTPKSVLTPRSGDPGLPGQGTPDSQVSQRGLEEFLKRSETRARATPSLPTRGLSPALRALALSTGFRAAKLESDRRIEAKRIAEGRP